MSGGGGFRGRGFVPQGHCRQGSDGSGGPKPCLGRPGSRQSNTGYPRSDGPGCGPRPSGRGGRSRRNPRNGGSNFRGGPGSASSPRPNFNLTRHPPRHQSRPPDNWPPRGGGVGAPPRPMFNPWQGGRPMRFNTPPPFFRGRGQNAFPPFRYPPPPIGTNYPPPPFTEFPPTVDPKPQVPHLGSEEERQQKITEAADKLKRTLSSVAKEQSSQRTYNENDDETIVRADGLVPDHESRITSRGIPELKHDPPELHLTVGDLRDIGRVDLDHTARTTKVDVASTSTSDDQDVVILAHNPVQEKAAADMIEIDTWADDKSDDSDMERTMQEPVSYTTEVMSSPRCLEDPVVYSCNDTINKETTNELQIGGESAVANKTENSIQTQSDQQDETSKSHTPNVEADTSVIEKRTQEKMVIDQCQDDSNIGTEEMRVLFETTATAVDSTNSSTIRDKIPLSRSIDNLGSERDVTPLNKIDKTLEIVTIRGTETEPNNSDRLNINMTIKTGKKKDRNEHSQIETTNEISVDTRDPTTNKDIRGTRNELSDQNVNARVEEMEHAMEVLDKSQDEAPSKSGAESGSIAIDEKLKETRDKINSESQSVPPMAMQRGKTIFQPHVEIEKEALKNNTSRESSSDKQDETRSKLTDDNNFCENKIPKDQDVAISESRDNASLNRQSDNEITDGGAATKRMQKTREKCEQLDSSRQIENPEKSDCSEYKKSTGAQSAKSEDRGKAERTASCDVMKKKQQDGKFDNCRVEYLSTCPGKNSDDHRNSQSNLLMDEKNSVRRKLVKQIPKGSVTSKERRTVPGGATTRSASTDFYSNESSTITDSPVFFDPRAPPPSVRPYDHPPPSILAGQEEQPQLPPAFDPRLSTLDRRVLMSSALPINQDFTMTQSYPSCPMTNLVPNVPPLNYVSPAAIMGAPIESTSNIRPMCINDPYTPIMPLPSVPVTAPIVLPMQPPLPTEPPPPPPPPGKSSLDMEDELEDMHEAMEFAKQLMNMTESSTGDVRMNDREDSEDSDFFHMPTFPDLPPIELPPLPPVEPDKNTRRDCPVSSSKECKKTNKKYEPATYGPLPKSEAQSVVTDAIVEIPGISDEQLRPKVVFNLSSKTKVIVKQEDWRQQHLDDSIEVSTTGFTTKSATNADVPKNRKNNKSSSEWVTLPVASAKKDKLGVNGQEEKKKPVEKGSRYNGKVGQTSPISFSNKKTEESKLQPSTLSPSTLGKSTNLDKEPLGHSISVIADKNSICRRKASRESSLKKPGDLQTPESTWKTRVIGRFLKMSKNDICNMLNNTSLRKFDIAMKHLVKERRSLGTRNNEEERGKDADVSYDTEEFMDQLSAMLDSSATVDVCNIPTQFIHHLSEVLQLDTLPEFEAALAGSDPGAGVSNIASRTTPPIVESRHTTREPMPSADSHEIDEREQLKRGREKSINTSVVGTAATATTVTCAATTTSIATPTATIQRTPNSRTREELVESSQCNVVCGENDVEQDAGTRVVIGPRSRRRRLRAARLAQQEASSTMKNGTVVRPMEQNSLNMADLDDIFTAGIARAKKKHTCVKTMMKSEKKEDHQLHVIERRVMPVVKDPNVDRVERAAVELDEIFTAGIAKAKLASKNAAAAAAKAAEANDGDDDDEEQGGHSWNYNEHKVNRENQRARSKLTTGATSKSDKWCRRKGHGNPDAFRNLTKEEWEAKFSESSYATYQREYRALAAMRARRTNRSPANPKNDLPTTESNEVTSVKSRLGDPVQPAAAYEAWSGSDESTRLRNVHDPSNNYDQHSDSSTSTSTSSDSTGQDEETDGSVTKLLKVIKQREKIAKKRSINEEIRDEVTAEIERKRREKEKLRKRHKTRTKKSSHRRKRDKKDKSRERKRHERKRKKRKIRHSGENSRELSDNADADEDTSSTSRGQQSHSLLTEEEIKKEAVIVIKDEPEAVSMVSSSKRSAKNSMQPGGNDDSRPPSTASSSSIPSITVTSTTTLVTGTHQLKTKAQLKQMPDIVTKFQPGTETSKGIAKAQPVVAPENPKENSIFKADYLTSPDVLMFNNELDNNSPHMTRPMPSAWTVPVQPGSTTGDDPSSTSKPSSKKLDIETYKERTRQRLHIENAKRRRIADNPSTLTHDLLNIPLTRKKLSETTGGIVQESREDVMSTSNTESSNTTTTVDTTITSTTTIDLTGSTPQLGIAALPARASVFQKESSQQVLPAKAPRKKIVRKVSVAASAAAAAAAAATAAAVAATSTSAGGITTIAEKSTAIGSSAGAGKFAHIKSEGQKELKLREKLRKGHSRPSIESLITDIPATEPMRLNRRKCVTGSTSVKESAVSSTKSNIDVALSSKNVNTSTDVSKTVDTSENLDTPTSSDTSTKLIATKSFHNKLKANAAKSLHTSTKTDAAKSLHTSTKNDAGKSLHTLKKTDAVKRLHTSTKIGAATSLNTSKNVAVLESLNTPTKDNVAKNLDNSMNVSVSESLDISAKNDVSRHLDASTNVEVSQTLLDTSISVDVPKSLDNTMDVDITKPLDISINAHPSKSLDLDVSKSLKISTNEDVSKRLNTSMNVDVSQSLDTSKNVNVSKNLDAPKDVDVSTNLDISTIVQESQSLNSFTDLDAPKNLIVSRNADLSKNLDTSTKTDVSKTLDSSTKVDVPKTLATSIKVDVPRALATSTKVDVQKTLDNSIKVDVSKSLDTSTKVDVSKSLDTLTKVDVPTSLNRRKVDVQSTLDTSAKVDVPETFNVSAKMNVSKTLNTMTDEIVSRSLDMLPSVEDVSTSLDKSENANVSKTLHILTDVPRSLDTAENVDILKSLESSTKEDTSETLNISTNGDESQIVDIPFKSNVSKSSDILTNVDLSQSLDSSKNEDVSKSLETSMALEMSEGLDPPTSLHVTKNMEVPENRLVSCILPTTIPQERLPVMKEKPTTTEALEKQRELQTLDISIEELPGWSLEAAVATCSKPDTVDYSSESQPFKGFIEQPILRRDRVLTEAKINAMETEALETVPLEFVVDSVISVREDADIADLTRTDVVETLDVPISYGDVAFTENRDVIETSLPDPLGQTIFSIANEIDDVPVSVTEGSVPNDGTSDENLELEESRAIVPPLIPTSAATNFLVENAEKQDIESSPLLDTKSRCNETNDIYTTDSTPKDTIGEPSHNKNTTIPIDDTKETTLSEHFVNKIVTESTSLKAELSVIKVDALQCSTDVANSTRDMCEMDIPQRSLEEFTVSRVDVEAHELGNNVTVSDETSSKEFVSSTLETSVVNIEKPHTTDISSSKEIDEPTQGTSVAMSSVTIDEHSREVEATSKDLHQSKSSMKEHGHSKSKKKSSRLHKHGSKTSSKTQLTEKMIEEAIATNVVKLVSKSSSKETVMARMIEIDVEIHKLMNEKMTLYKMLESNDFPTRHTTEIGTTSKTPDEAKTLETKEETSASEIVPPAVLTSRFMRNFTTPTRQQEDTTRKVEAKRVNSENESKMKKRKKSPQRESGKNHSREQDMSGVRHDRKNSESKSQSRRTPSEEPSRHESTLTNLREKSTSSTDLDDAEDRRRRRPTKSPNRHSSKRQNEHSSREDLHEALRDSADHTIKPTKHDRTKKNSKSPGETKRNEESPKKSKMQEEKANNNVRLSARHKTIQSGVIYSDESTRDSVNLEVVQSDEARGKKDNSGSSTGLALLEESFKREMAEQRRIKNVSKRKNKHREFGRTLVVPSLLTADEAQTGLANLINRKVARKRELAGSTEAKNGSSGNPVKVWEHVTSVIDAVAKNCVEQLYNADDTDQSSVEATTPDKMLVEEHENNKKEEREKEDSIQQRKEEPHKITIEPEQNESTRGDCYKSITSSVTTAESREFIESGETTEPSNLDESENRVASSILTETTSSGNLGKTPDSDIVSKRRMNKLDNIIIFEDKKIEKSVNEDSFTTKNSNKNELVEEGSTKYDESEATRDIDAAKEKREIDESKKKREIDESKKKREIDESKGKHAIDEIGKSIDVHRSTKSRSPSPEHAQGEIDELVEEFEIQKEDANKDLPGKTGVELTQEKSDDIIEKEGSEKAEFVSSSKETNEKGLHSRNRRSHSTKKRGKFHRETSSSTSDRKSHEDDKSNPLQLESSDHGHHEEKSPGRPRSANKRKPREKGGPPSRRSSRQSEDSGKPSRGKRRNEDRSNSRGLSPDDDEPLRKRTHYQSRRSSSPNTSATPMDDHSRRRGRKLKRRLELSHEEMINCRVELVDCKHTYLSPTMHPKILRKLGISKINPYVKPTCGSENLGHPKVTRIETPSPSILNKIAIIECPTENTAEEPEPKISAISNVPECLDISSPGVTIERSSSPCVIDNPKENVDEDDDEDDEDDEATIHIVKVVDESLPQTSIGDQDEETDNIEVVQEVLEPVDNAKTPTEVIAVEEDEPMDVDDPMEEYEIIDDIDDATDVGSDRANVSDEVQICEEKESGTSTEKTSQPERLPVTEDDDDVATQPRRTRYTVHKGPILDIKVLDDSFLAASEDGAIYRYSQTSNGILNIYKGHEAAVTCIHVLEMPGKRWNLYSGSLDGTFRCYDITTGAQDRLPANVGSPVQCMDEAWGTIYVGTKSGHISRYNIKSGSVKGDRLEFSDKSVLALKTCTEGPRRVLIVASRNQPITIRDALTGLFLRTVCGYKNHTVYSLLREGNLVYCGTSNTSIPVYNFTNGEQVTQYHAGVGIVCMRLYRQILFAGCYDGNIYVFDTEESKLVCSIPGPGNMLLSMEVVDDEIIAGSKNRQLHSWRMPREVRALLAKRT